MGTARQDIVLQNEDLMQEIIALSPISDYPKIAPTSRFFGALIRAASIRAVSNSSLLLAHLQKLSPATLCKCAERKEQIALAVLNNPLLYEMFGAYDQDRIFWINEKSRTGIGDPAIVALADGSYLFRVGNAYPSATKIILENPILRARLNPRHVAELERIGAPRMYVGGYHGL